MADQGADEAVNENADEEVEEVVGEEVFPEIDEIEAMTVENAVVNKPIIPTLLLTPNQKEDIKQAFDFLDYKGAGVIDSTKYKIALQALGYEPTTEEVRRAVDAIDKERSGKLSLEEFTTLIMRKIVQTDRDEDIIKSFLLFDMQDAGFVSFEDLKSVCEVLGEDLSDEEILEMLEYADEDTDGEVSREEFLKVIHKAVTLRTP